MKKISLSERKQKKENAVENSVFNRLFNNFLWKTLREWYQTNREGRRMGYSHRVFCCPYYEKDGAKSVRCEGGRIALPNMEVTRAYFDAYCGHVTGWRRCTVARAITRFYEAEDED